ncbi:MAG: conserved hypothetical protein partial [Methanobrevibacter sp. CfCl-M3]
MNLNYVTNHNFNSRKEDKFNESSLINKSDTKNANRSNIFSELIPTENDNGTDMEEDPSTVVKFPPTEQMNDSNQDMSLEGILKSKFASWYLETVTLPKHKKWLGNDLESKLEEIDNKYHASFYSHLFDIDIVNLKDEVNKIRQNIQSRRSVMDKSFENYIRMTDGVAKEVISYYITFLEKVYKKLDFKKGFNKVDWIDVAKKDLNNMDFLAFTLRTTDNRKDEKFPEKKTVEKKFCRICSERLLTGSSKSLCKGCQRKIYGVKILKNLLSHISPGIEFSVDDLINIGFKKIKAKDYIWTLIELNLLNEDEENRYSLKSQNILEKFIKDNSDDGNNLNRQNMLIQPVTTKLNKVCVVCNKNLVINKFHKSKNSEDGYQNYCKECLKSVNVVKYLSKLLLFVDYEEYFDFNDLKNNFSDKIEFNHYVWSIQEFDLICQKNGRYVFKDKEKIDAFIKNYKKFLD